MTKIRRASKWTFLLYKDSMPENYLDILERMRTPYALSPWHDKDVNKETGEFKKPHKHGVLFFDSLKSYYQVSELLTENLNTPAHIEIVMSPLKLIRILFYRKNQRLRNIEISIFLSLIHHKNGAGGSRTRVQIYRHNQIYIHSLSI